MLVKRFLSILACMLLAISAFLQWLPHEVVHAIHIQSVSHSEKVVYAGNVHEHSAEHNANEHEEPKQDTAHHAINLDVITFFDDYLNVDMRNPNRPSASVLLQVVANVDFEFTSDLSQKKRYITASVGIPVPRHWEIPKSPYLPVYFSTQRFRI